MEINIEIELEKIKTKSFNSEEEKNKELECLYKISNDNESILFELGKSYFLLSKFDSAIFYFLKVLQINKGNINSVDLLNKSYKAQNKIYKSLRLLYKYRYFFVDIANEEIVSIYVNCQRYDLIIKYIYKYMDGQHPLKDSFCKYAISLISKNNVENNINKVFKYSKKILNVINKDSNIKFYNSILNELEISQQKTILKSYPRRLTVSLISSCNLRCKMCPYDKNKLFALSKYQVDDIISILPYIEEVEWNGGEAFLFEYFNELLDAAYKNNVKQYITSNGLLINDIYAEKIVKYDIDLTFSIDSVDKILYESIRVGAKFDLLIKRIEKINYYAKKLNRNANLSINCVLSKYNYEKEDNFSDIIKFAKKYGFSKVRISIDQYDTDKELINTILLYFQGQKKKLVEIASKLKIDLQFIMPQIKQGNVIFMHIKNNVYNEKKENVNLKIKDKQIASCLLPLKKIHISFNGNMRPECLCQNVATLFKKEDNKNINGICLPSYNSIEDFWNCRELILLREKIYSNKLDCVKNCYLSEKIRYDI